MKRLARYLAYLAFLAFALVVVGLLPFWFLGNALGDPACHFEPGGCPQPSILHQALDVVLGIGSVPLTVVAFIFYRKFVHRLLDAQGEEGRNQ